MSSNANANFEYLLGLPIVHELTKKNRQLHKKNKKLTKIIFTLLDTLVLSREKKADIINSMKDVSFDLTDEDLAVNDATIVYIKEEKKPNIVYVLEEEEEVVRRPPPKVTKSKRTNKKMSAWYAVPELEAEPYSM